MTRWATFDCYGTLIDWNGGIGDELARLWGDERRDELLARYHELEPGLQAGAGGVLPYRTVLTEALVALAAEEGLDLPEGETDALARSLPTWRAFPEVPASLSAVRERGWRIAILSNTDRDYIEASLAMIGVPFDEVVVASEIGSYKPAHGHWRAFSERTGADPARHVHVGASLFHDAHPAAELGLPMVWINREAERATVPVARQLPTLDGLATALAALVPE
jgi:2-haloacid dehalogenase